MPHYSKTYARFAEATRSVGSESFFSFSLTWKISIMKEVITSVVARVIETPGWLG